MSNRPKVCTAQEQHKFCTTYIKELVKYINYTKTNPKPAVIGTMLCDIQEEMLPKKKHRAFDTKQNIDNFLMRKRDLLESIVREVVPESAINYNLGHRRFYFITPHKSEVIQTKTTPVTITTSYMTNKSPIDSLNTKQVLVTRANEKGKVIDSPTSSLDQLVQTMIKSEVDKALASIVTPLAAKFDEVTSLLRIICDRLGPVPEDRNIRTDSITNTELLKRKYTKKPKLIIETTLLATNDLSHISDEELDRLTAPEVVINEEIHQKLPAVPIRVKAIPQKKYRVYIYGLLPQQRQHINSDYPHIEFIHAEKKTVGLKEALNTVDYAIGMIRFMPHAVEDTFKAVMKDRYRKCIGSVSSLKVLIDSLNIPKLKHG